MNEKKLLKAFKLWEGESVKLLTMFMKMPPSDQLDIVEKALERHILTTSGLWHQSGAHCEFKGRINCDIRKGQIQVQRIMLHEGNGHGTFWDNSLYSFGQINRSLKIVLEREEKKWRKLL